MPTLDGIRAIAILLVMAHHYAQFLSPLHAVDGAVLGAARAGWVGVDLFFVLSGFLITGILHDTRYASNYFGSFYARRVLRIFPLYYGALIVAFVVVPLVIGNMLGATAGDWLWFGLYGSNFLTALDGWPVRYVNHFWSLAIEEQFYLLWPLFVFLLSRRGMIALSAVLIVAAPVLRALVHDGGEGNTAIYTLTFTRMDALAMGALVALLLRDPSTSPWLRRLAPWVAAVAVPIAALMLLRSTAAPAWLVWSLPGQIMGYSVIALASGAGIAWSVTASPGAVLNVWLASAAFRFIGRYSYAMYVLHVPLDTAARALDLHGMELPLEVGAVTPVLLVYSLVMGSVTVGLAVLSWKLLESPFLALKRHFDPVFPRPGRAAPSFEGDRTHGAPPVHPPLSGSPIAATALPVARRAPATRDESRVLHASSPDSLG